MKKMLLVAIAILFITSPGLRAQSSAATGNNKALNDFFATAFDELLKLNPTNATSIGDNRYNDQLPAEFTDSHRDKLKAFYKEYLAKLSKFNRGILNDNDKIS